MKQKMQQMFESTTGLTETRKKRVRSHKSRVEYVGF